MMVAGARNPLNLEFCWAAASPLSANSDCETARSGPSGHVHWVDEHCGPEPSFKLLFPSRRSHALMRASGTPDVESAETSWAK